MNNMSCSEQNQDTVMVHDETLSIDEEIGIMEQTGENNSNRRIDDERESSDSLLDNDLCCICSVDVPVLRCSGSSPHGLCIECFQGYAKSSFEFNSEYERVREQDNLSSLPGQLPCPYFIAKKCNCTALNEKEFLRFFDNHMFQMWRQADGRVQVKSTTMENDYSNVNTKVTKEQISPLETLYRTVKEAMVDGCTVSCPNCKTKGEKDDKCIHIKCDICSANWCYCCGHIRGGPDGTCRCDTISAFLESNPGWGNFVIGTESPAQGALHEFHRQRTMYLLRQLKESTTGHLWDKLRKEYPSTFDDVPTIGRRIDWDSIDSAVLPTFGQTKSTSTNHPISNIENRHPIRFNPMERLSTIIQNISFENAFPYLWCLSLLFFIVTIIGVIIECADGTGLVFKIGFYGYFASFTIAFLGTICCHPS